MKFLSFLKNKPKIIVVCGPTATGKTSLAIEIAKKYNGEIISTDSRQVYRGLDIGSAKVTNEEMQDIPHHMIDIADPRERFTVQEFLKQGTVIINEIISRKKIAILCGGTGMYIDALVNHYTFPNVAPNPKLRNQLSEKSTKELFNILQSQDPQRAKSIDRHNKVRLIRALEITNQLGSVPSQKRNSPYKTLFIGLDLPDDLLHKRIHQRIIDRFENEAMLNEARNLHTSGLTWDRMEELGLEYRYMAQHLQGKISYDKMIQTLFIATRQFVKRQRTWFKRNKKIKWFNPQEENDAVLQQVDMFLRK